MSVNALIDVRDGKTLYAIMYEKRVVYYRGRERRRKWVPGSEYLHAKDLEDARLQYFNSEAPKVMQEVRIVGIAPVIGYHVNDNHGDDITV
jgi:hypothetical protein